MASTWYFLAGDETALPAGTPVTAVVPYRRRERQTFGHQADLRVT
ncbi:hypothetical protein [Flindersiella endophytica]